MQQRLLKQQEGGRRVAEICREQNISPKTFSAWKGKYGGFGYPLGGWIKEAQRLRHPEAENAKLKRLVAEQALDIIALKDITSKNW